MANSSQKPINGIDSGQVEHMVCGQIEQRFDSLRMRQFWARVFAGDNDPAQIAEGLCRALSGGHYVRREQASVLNVSVTVPPGVSPADVAQAVKAAVSVAAN